MLEKTIHRSMSPVFMCTALEFTEASKLATEQFRPQSGQFLTLESFAARNVSSRLPRR